MGATVEKPKPKKVEVRVLRRFVMRGGKLVEVEKVKRETRG